MLMSKIYVLISMEKYLRFRDCAKITVHEGVHSAIFSATTKPETVEGNVKSCLFIAVEAEK